MMDHMRDNRKFKPGQACTNRDRDRVNRETKSISGNNKKKKKRESCLSNRTTEEDIYIKDKEGEKRIIQEIGENSNNNVAIFVP